MSLTEINLTPVEKELLMIYVTSQEKKDAINYLKPQKSATILGLTRPRTYTILSKLKEKGILEKKKRLGFSLSKVGHEVIDVLNHRKQILEIFLHQELNFDLETASKESLKLLLAVSDKIIDRLCKKMGEPLECPHKIKIPHNLDRKVKVSHQMNK